MLIHGLLLPAGVGPERVGEGNLRRNVVKNLQRKLEDSAQRPRYVFTEPRVRSWMAAGRGIRRLPGNAGAFCVG